MPAELMKRSFNGSPPAALSEQIQCACLRVPVEKDETIFGPSWFVVRPPLPGLPKRSDQILIGWLPQDPISDGCTPASKREAEHATGHQATWSPAAAHEVEARYEFVVIVIIVVVTEITVGSRVR